LPLKTLDSMQRPSAGGGRPISSPSDSKRLWRSTVRSMVS
jgi:hypothetical protein